MKQQLDAEIKHFLDSCFSIKDILCNDEWILNKTFLSSIQTNTYRPQKLDFP